MAIEQELADKFFDMIEFPPVDWKMVDEIATSDANILRPIKGICFEEMFRKIFSMFMQNYKLEAGPKDSDVDFVLYVNDEDIETLTRFKQQPKTKTGLPLTKLSLQLKTVRKGSTKDGQKFGVSLHKTHGDETSPNNLYKTNKKVFDFLIILHPEEGIVIVPYDKIPENRKFKGYLADPAEFDWNTEWRNRWDLLGFPMLRGKSLERRTSAENSLLPKLSQITYLTDGEIISALCRPENFRAAVMGLKGNVKQHWLSSLVEKLGYRVEVPSEKYAKYDFIVSKSGRRLKVQAKGTSRNLCDRTLGTLGVEIMGTHGQFPSRGYKRSEFDYLGIIISRNQLDPRYSLNEQPHFVFIPSNDIPLHYLIGKGDPKKAKGKGNLKWNNPVYKDVLYPIVKLETAKNNSGQIEVNWNFHAYGKSLMIKLKENNPDFGSKRTYLLDKIPF